MREHAVTTEKMGAKRMATNQRLSGSGYRSFERLVETGRRLSRLLTVMMAAVVICLAALVSIWLLLTPALLG